MMDILAVVAIVVLKGKRMILVQRQETDFGADDVGKTNAMVVDLQGKRMTCG